MKFAPWMLLAATLALPAWGVADEPVKDKEVPAAEAKPAPRNARVEGRRGESRRINEDGARSITYKANGEEITRTFTISGEGDSRKMAETKGPGGESAETESSPELMAWMMAHMGFVEPPPASPEDADAKGKGSRGAARNRPQVTGTDGKKYVMTRFVGGPGARGAEKTGPGGEELVSVEGYVLHEEKWLTRKEYNQKTAQKSGERFRESMKKSGERVGEAGKKAGENIGKSLEGMGLKPNKKPAEKKPEAAPAESEPAEEVPDADAEKK